MFKVATGHLGISPFLYYELTYRELDLMIQGYLEKRNQDIEFQAITSKLGYINAKNGTNYKVFEDESKQNEIDPEFKQQELNELKKLFS